MERNKGITLVALVVTIILILIIAGAGIGVLTGEGGLFSIANEASSRYLESARNEAERFNLAVIQTEPVPGLVINEQDLTKSNVSFKSTPDVWTNLTKEASVKVEISTTVEGQYYTLQYSLDNGNNWTNYTEPIEVTKNEQVILARLAERNRAGLAASYQVLNIDTVAPKGFEVTTTEIEETSMKINARTEDGDKTETSGKSGIKEYKYYIKGENDTEYKQTTSTPTGLTAGETYNIYVEAYDNAGNKTTSNTITQKTLGLIPNLIKETNVIFTSIPSTNINPSLYGNKKGVKIEIEDRTNSGYQLQYSIDEGETWNNYTSESEIYIDKYKDTVVVQMVDLARPDRGSGGTDTYTVLNIDTLAPNPFEFTKDGVTNTTITISGQTTDTVNTTISANSNISYKYAIRTSRGTIDWESVTDENTTGTWTFTGLSSTTTYYIYMAAIDEAKNITEATNKGIEAVCHVHNYVWTTTKEPTCTTAGSKIKKCECGETTGTAQTIAATGHSESSTWSKNSTQHWKVCKTCGAITTSKTNHTESSTWKTDGTYHWKECSTCGYVTTSKTKHSYSYKTTKAATCGDAGSEIQTCTCGKTTGSARTIAATGKHTATQYRYVFSKSNGTNETWCIYTMSAKCGTCGAICSYGYKVSLGHSCGSSYVTGQTSSWVTNGTMTRTEKCSKCGASRSDTWHANWATSVGNGTWPSGWNATKDNVTSRSAWSKP